MKYQNYHRHSHFSNIIVPDSTTRNEEYAIRAVELGHGIISGVEHGWCGRYIESYELAKQYGLKFVFGTETYFVKDRLQKDKTNAHIVLLAKNENGRRAIITAISNANLTGYYYRARIDNEILFSLPPKDVWVTTACVGGIWKYDDADKIMLEMAEHFGQNFFLEVQAHNTDSQRLLNSKIINLANKNNLKIIFGCDSHMISPDGTQDRDDFLASKHIVYEDEQGWYLDYPSDEDVIQRFEKQGALTKFQVAEAMENTNITLDVEEYSPVIFGDDIKMPTIYPSKSQDERDTIFIDLIWDRWSEEKNNVPPERWNEYESEIKKEVKIVIETKHSDYFLLNHAIVNLGISKGGVITASGRGSGGSFYINKLLSLTQMDRISAPVKMYPERFLSVARILETKSLADFDMNLGNPEVFINAQNEIMGNDSAYPMLAFGTMKPRAAWKMYARAKGVDFDIANSISDQIGFYERALLNAEDDDEIELSDYIDSNYIDLFIESGKYQGIVSELRPHPCAHLIYQGNIREEIGLIRINSAGGTSHICCTMDGNWGEQYKFLKNDLLKVSTVQLTDAVYKRIKTKQHSVSELIKLCKDDPSVWQVYHNAWTMGINQFEQHGTAGRAAKYKPGNISELSAFVAAIRPGFQSMYTTFESREPFNYGIDIFDALIQTPEMPNSFVLYQEQSMAALNYAGIPMSECYDVVKNIAKKRAEKVFKYKKKFISGFSKRIIEDSGVTTAKAKIVSDSIWQILEDSSRYSFNASHSYCVAIDSLYGAYLKANYPLEFYETFMRIMEEDGDKDRLHKAQVEAHTAYGISFPRLQFGQDNREIAIVDGDNAIAMSLKSLKGFGQKISEELFRLSQIEYSDFIDFLVKAENESMVSKKFETLIQIGYFREFGRNKKLLEIFKEFKSGKSRYSRKYIDKTKEKRLAGLKELWNNLPDMAIPFRQQIYFDISTFGMPQATYPINKKYIYAVKVDERYAPRVESYCLATGETVSLKIQKRIFERNYFSGDEIIYCEKFEKKPTVKMIDGKFVELENDYTWWISKYRIVDESEINNLINKGAS